MAKTYLNVVKYEIIANYFVEGVVEKPDIVGAIFGQCEGLLGEDMDLKELQQSGKLGRIEITVKKGKGTTSGEIIIPSSLDQVKTSILAATIETVEKVGPFEAKVKVLKISDTRKDKRENIADRAKELLKKMQKFEGVESDDLANSIKTEIRAEKIVNYNGLQAGPEVESSPEIIVVEGRADVLKLLSYGINNAVAMNGGNIDAALINLCKQKIVTVLIDGDRGGELNAKKLSSLTKVDFVAKAPDGKEVEELTQKEILQALKRKSTLAEAFGKRDALRYLESPQKFEAFSSTFGRNGRPRFEQRPRFGQRNTYQLKEGTQFVGRNFNTVGNSRFGRRNDAYGGRGRFYDRVQSNIRLSYQRNNSNDFTPNEQYSLINQQSEIIPEEVKSMQKEFEKLKGKSKARLLDEKGKKIKEVKVKDLLESLKRTKKSVSAVLFDGIVTNRLVEVAEAKKVKTIIGVKRGNINPTQTKVYTM